MIDRGLILRSFDDDELLSNQPATSSESEEAEPVIVSHIVTAPPQQQPPPQIITKPSLHQLRIQLPSVLQLAQATANATAEQYRHDGAGCGPSVVQRLTTEQVRNPNSVTVVVIKTMLPE